MAAEALKVSEHVETVDAARGDSRRLHRPPSKIADPSLRFLLMFWWLGVNRDGAQLD